MDFMQFTSSVIMKRREATNRLMGHFIGRTESTNDESGQKHVTECIWIDRPEVQSIQKTLAHIVQWPGSVNQMEHEYIRIVGELQKNWLISIQVSFVNDDDVPAYKEVVFEIIKMSLVDAELSKAITIEKTKLVNEVIAENGTVTGIQWFYCLNQATNQQFLTDLCQMRGHSFALARSTHS
jgi:hypothetical protein